MKSRFKVGDRVVTVLLVPALARIVGAAVLTVLIIGLTVAFADGGRPPPVPQLSTGCPPGYSGSPTSGTCVPSGNTGCRAFPAPRRDRMPVTAGAGVESWSRVYR
jgi:hypothetical protein